MSFPDLVPRDIGSIQYEERLAAELYADDGRHNITVQRSSLLRVSFQYEQAIRLLQPLMASETLLDKRHYVACQVTAICYCGFRLLGVS